MDSKKATLATTTRNTSINVTVNIFYYYLPCTPYKYQTGLYIET